MRILQAASLAATMALLVGPMPAAASCAGPIPMAEALRKADSVFTGSVVGTANTGRTATVAVDEVWRGPDLPARVVVQGGPDGNVATSIDRTWEAGGRYLVFAAIVDSQLTDNACSSTQIWSDELEALQPSDARPPSDSGPSGTSGGLTGPWLAIVGAVAAIGAVSFLAFRKGR